MFPWPSTVGKYPELQTHEPADNILFCAKSHVRHTFCPEHVLHPDPQAKQDDWRLS